ncbi:MAG: glycosyltransferase family 4 protein [Anaerolineae bacterium]|nr:glycosyltransferase family 4 protein [Anaerolineae bacterium]
MTEHKTPLKVLLLSPNKPAPTGSGGIIAAYGHGASVAQAGYQVEFAVPFPKGNAADIGYPVHFLEEEAPSQQAQIKWFGELLKTVKPDFVWLFHFNHWDLFAPYRQFYPHAILLGDPEWQTQLIRAQFRHPQRSLGRKFLDYLALLQTVRCFKAEEKRVITEAHQYGVVASFSVYDTPGMSQRSGVPAIHNCPLAFPDWGERAEATSQGKPQALMLGNLNGAQTRTGLRFFFTEVWPHWVNHVDPPRSIVRIVGKGKLPDYFPHPQDHEKLEWIGFVPSLEDEWNQATAVLVPVPIEQGIRTRIVEAWSKAAPVIAHPSAEAAIPEMKAGVNYLAAIAAEEWIAALRRLESDPAFARTIAQNGRRTYEQFYAVEPGAARFGKLMQLAFERFQAKHREAGK